MLYKPKPKATTVDQSQQKVPPLTESQQIVQTQTEKQQELLSQPLKTIEIRNSDDNQLIRRQIITPPPRFSSQENGFYQMQLNQLKENRSIVNLDVKIENKSLHFYMDSIKAENLKWKSFFKIEEIFDENKSQIPYQGFGVKNLDFNKIEKSIESKEFPIIMNHNQFAYKTNQNLDQYKVLITPKNPKTVKSLPSDFTLKEENIVNILLFLQNQLKNMKHFSNTFKIEYVYLIDQANPTSFSFNLAEYAVISFIDSLDGSRNKGNHNSIYRMLGEFAKKLSKNEDHFIIKDIIYYCQEEEIKVKIVDQLLRTFYVENPLFEIGDGIISLLESGLKNEEEKIQVETTQTSKVEFVFSNQYAQFQSKQK